MTCSLNTRCSVIAAASVKGRSYDLDTSLTENTGISSPLLSRFDIILLLNDVKNSEWDSKLARNILSMDCGSNINVATVDSSSSATTTIDGPHNKLWSFDTLKNYFRFMKSKQPDLTTESVEVLTKYYEMKRAMECQQTGNRITVRTLESLIR